MAGVSRSLHQLGVPFALRWTHLESTCATSVLTFTLGHRFHFRTSLDGGCNITVSALPGLHNHADQRTFGLRSADDLQQFLLGEICRQIVLTFGDIAAAWTDDIQTCFRVDLVPPTVSLWREKFGEPTSPGNNLDHDDGVTRCGCEVRVSPREVSSCSVYTNVDFHQLSIHLLDADRTIEVDGLAFQKVREVEFKRAPGFPSPYP